MSSISASASRTSIRPAHIVEAAHQAALGGARRATRRPRVRWTLQARRSRAKLERENTASPTRTDEIIISNGAKQVLFDAMMATMEPGQEVLLCAPLF